MNKFKVGDYVIGNCQEVCEEGWLSWGEATQVKGVNGDLILVDSCFNKDGMWQEHWMFDICSTVKWCLWLKLKKTKDCNNTVGKIFVQIIFGVRVGGQYLKTSCLTKMTAVRLVENSCYLTQKKMQRVSL